MIDGVKRLRVDLQSSYAFTLAADARLSETNYVDDQVWTLSPGRDDDPAFALQTKFGGRVGLASLVPIFQIDGRIIYKSDTYAISPQVSSLAPAYIHAHAQIQPTIAIEADFWAMESHAIGCRLRLINNSDIAVSIRIDLFGHVILGDREQPLAILTLSDQTHALSLGKYSGLQPVVIFEEAHANLSSISAPSPKIGVDLALQAGNHVSVRWVHAGLPIMADSLERAQFWLSQDWDSAFTRIEQATHAIPEIETGDSELDETIAFSYRQLLLSFINATENLPAASIVATRNPSTGYSRRGDGSDYGRGWNGQSPQLAYLTALSIATIEPEFAKGIVRNYFATQRDDGWIESQPGLGGQKPGLLCPPLLARMVWEIFKQTDDVAFLAEAFPQLLKFFNRWSELDLDASGNVLPEWQDERQLGYLYFPMFGAGQSWAQNVQISYIESPDLAAYLLSEVNSLQAIARVLGDSGAYELDSRIAQLQIVLETLWDSGLARYTYVDRDIDMNSPSIIILEDGQGDKEHLLALQLGTSKRLLVRITGGTTKIPKANLYIKGLDSEGQSVEEIAGIEDFLSGYGVGVYTTKYIYAMVDSVRFEGLSRVYRVNVRSIDYTRLDINALMPLWSNTLSPEQAKALAKLLGQELHFLRPSGLTIVSAQDDAFDPSSANGGGGVWTYWTTLMGQATLDTGYPEIATEILRRLLETQKHVLNEQGRLSEFYHSDKQKGLGEDGHLAGIAPLFLFSRIIGIQIIHYGKVLTGGPFLWGNSITVKQHGVIVTRSKKRTRIEFPSGKIATLPADAEWQAVIDPNESIPTPIDKHPFPSGIRSSDTGNRVIIEIDDNNQPDP
jgi:hypothetical protein